MLSEDYSLTFVLPSHVIAHGPRGFLNTDLLVINPHSSTGLALRVFDPLALVIDSARSEPTPIGFEYVPRALQCVG